MPCNASLTAGALLLDIRWTMAMRVFLSTSVRRAWSFDLFPRTVSISQCPNSSRVSIDSGLSSMLVPRILLLLLGFEDFVFRRSFKTKSMFFTFKSRSEEHTSELQSRGHLV